MDAGGPLLREGLALVGSVGGPMFAALFTLGLGLGVLQAATQVNDPAVGFLPRLAAAAAVCAALGSWMVERLAGFVQAAFHQMAQGG
ncbi:MAG: flagellar biosynthetic protein FliQ [Myxococcaceae bacterium]|nr:flagellar biosynthetic protein FliQ [Myxococcaceae bacterium]